MKKYFIKLNIMIVILFACHTVSAQTISKTVKFEDKTYTVSIDSIIDNTEGKISVRIKTKEEMTLPIRKGNVTYPILIKMVTGQETIMPTNGIVMGSNFVMMSFITSKTPGKIIVYGNDDKKTEAVFTVTKNMIVVKKETKPKSEPKPESEKSPVVDKPVENNDLITKTDDKSDLTAKNEPEEQRPVSVRKFATIGTEEEKTQSAERQAALVKVEPDYNTENEEGEYKKPQRRMLSSQEGGLPVQKEPERQASAVRRPEANRTTPQNTEVKREKKIFIDLALAAAVASPKEGEGMTFTGYGVGFGYMLKNRHRLYVDIGVYEYSDEIVKGFSIDYTLVPVTVSWNYVLFPTKKLHLRIGPAIGFASLDAEYKSNSGEKIGDTEKIATSFLAGVDLGFSWDISQYFKLDIGYKSLVSPGFNTDEVDFSEMLLQPFLSIGLKF